MLPRPCDGRIEQAGDADPVRKPTVNGGFDGSAPIASETLERIAALYAIEKTIRGRSAGERRAVRQEKSKPLVLALA
jgi:Transposase IS66 family